MWNSIRLICVNTRYIKFQDNGLTPLMIAVKENKLVIAERLLELGVNVNDRAKVSLYFKNRDYLSE